MGGYAVGVIRAGELPFSASDAGAARLIRHFDPRGQRRRRCTRAARAFVAMALMAIAVRLTVRDTWIGFDTFFYMTPLPVIAGAYAAGALCLARAGRRGASLACAAAAAAVFVWFHLENWRSGPAASSGDVTGRPVRVAVWNMAAAGRGLIDCGQRLRDFDADVIGIVENRLRGGWNDHWLAVTLPEYQRTFGYEQMVIATRGPVRDVSTHALGDGSRCLSLLYEIDGRYVRIALADISHSVFRSRRKPIERLAALVDEWRRHTPVLVAGDFNTPADSALFEPLRRSCRNAFEVAGRGYPTTWPVPIPVLSLDQIWLTADLTPIACEAVWTTLSDHRPMVLTLSTAGAEQADGRDQADGGAPPQYPNLAGAKAPSPVADR
jgi:vancomycin resistance protein VanJ